MTKLRKVVSFCVALSTPFVAHAALPAPPSPGPSNLVVDLDALGANPLLDAVGLSTTRSFFVPLNRALGFGQLTLWVDYQHANNGTITVTCRGARKQASGTPSPTYELEICDVQTNGDCVLVAASKFLNTVTTDLRYQIAVGVTSSSNVVCTVAHSAGTSSDIVTIKGDLVTQ